jgi:hypothetical protein
MEIRLWPNIDLDSPTPDFDLSSSEQWKAKSILPSSGEMPRPILLRPIEVFIPQHLSQPLSTATDPLLVV